MKPLRLLIVEDEPLIALEISALAQDLGHEVIGLAHDYSSGLSLAAAAKPDVVLLDIKLGDRDCDGLDLALQLQRRRSSQIIVISSFVQSSDRRLARIAPAAVLPKPVDERDLRSALAGLVARHL